MSAIILRNNRRKIGAVMKLYKQIWIEILQRPFRSLTLFITVFVLSIFSISSAYISIAIESCYQEYVKKDGYCINVEIDPEQPLKNWKPAIENVLKFDEVVGYNNAFELSKKCQAVNFHNISYQNTKHVKKEKNEIYLVGDIDIQYREYFRNRDMELIKGSYPSEHSKGVLVAEEVAKENTLDIGDEIKIQYAEEDVTGLKIIGIYKTENVPKVETEIEGYYEESLNSFLFCDYESYHQVVKDKEELSVMSFFVGRYEDMEQGYEHISAEFKDVKNVLVINTIENDMSDIKKTIDIMRTVTNILLYFSVICSFLIIGLISCLWMKDHVKVIELYRILGQNKIIIVVKIIGEVIPIALSGVIGALLISHYVFPVTLVKKLSDLAEVSSIMEMRTNMGRIIARNGILIGGIAVGICICISIVAVNLSIRNLRRLK